MGHTKRTEIEVGWLKVVFTVITAVDVTLIGWLSANYDKATPALVIVGGFAAIIFMIVVFTATLRVYHLLNQEAA